MSKNLKYTEYTGDFPKTLTGKKKDQLKKMKNKKKKRK